jgi:hypothetical protein
MYYVQLYEYSTGWNGKDFSGPKTLIKKCGTDSVARLDSRLAYYKLCKQAEGIARQRGAAAYAVFRARDFSGRSETQVSVVTTVL